MQTELFSEQSPSGGYEDKVTIIEILSRQLFCYYTTNQDAIKVARVKKTLCSSMHTCRQQSNPTRDPDLSQVIKETAEILEIARIYASPRHTRLIGNLKTTLALFKEPLKIETAP